MRRTGTTRRHALIATGAVAAAGVLGACTADGPAGPASAAATERAARAEAALRRRSAATSATLLARYDDVLAVHPGLTARLAPLRAAVAAHVTALAPPGASPAPSGPATPTAPAVPTAPEAPARAAAGAAAGTPVIPVGTVPADAGVAVAELAAAVRRTADAHAAALLTAPPEYARLLASVAAAGAAHAYLLTSEGRPS
ncbi:MULTISPECIES: hypothetical protein [Streptomyces]|uniref:hypothetical protein n=1 Tax=Streptomyces TaxID=1883 RepID=UPI0007CD4929|nr:hypothetical protein A4V12_26640 [Streptomyces noursei]